MIKLLVVKINNQNIKLPQDQTIFDNSHLNIFYSNDFITENKNKINYFR